MLTRRSLLSGGVLTGAVAGGSSPRVRGATMEQSSSRANDEKIEKALDEIKTQLELANGLLPDYLTTIRGLQKDFLKARGKFPDFVEVGIDVWNAIIDWHTRTRQRAEVTRMADGRCSIPVFLTNVILRHDVSDKYIGQPFDTRVG